MCTQFINHVYFTYSYIAPPNYFPIWPYMLIFRWCFFFLLDKQINVLHVANIFFHINSPDVTWPCSRWRSSQPIHSRMKMRSSKFHLHTYLSLFRPFGNGISLQRPQKHLLRIVILDPSREGLFLQSDTDTPMDVTVHYAALGPRVPTTTTSHHAAHIGGTHLLIINP